MGDNRGYILFKLMMLLVAAACCYLMYRGYLTIMDSVQEKASQVGSVVRQAARPANPPAPAEKISGRGVEYEVDGGMVASGKKIDRYYPDTKASH